MAWLSLAVLEAHTRGVGQHAAPGVLQQQGQLGTGLGVAGLPQPALQAGRWVGRGAVVRCGVMGT